MEYTVVVSAILSSLISMVNEEMGKGWAPLGGIAPNHGVFYQAMIRTSAWGPSFKTKQERVVVEDPAGTA